METKVFKKKLFIYALLGTVLSFTGCFYYHSDDYRDRDYGYYNHGYYTRGDYPSSRSFHDDTDHRIDQD